MKKIRIIGTLLLITVLLISSQAINGEKETKQNNDVIQEDELVLEDWMTKPFVTDTVKQ